MAEGKNPQCEKCGREKNSFADLRRMFRRVGGSLEAIWVCAATYSCRDKAEKEGYRG